MSRRSTNESRGPVNRFTRNNGQQAEVTDETYWPEQANQLSATLVEKIENTIQARPLTCLGIAAGLGALAAFWSKRR